jgi:hypothetical protein
MADDPFLSRWSRRKADARQGKEVEAEPKIEVPQPAPQPSPASGRASAEEKPPAPTLEEAQSLSFDADFRRFVAPDVAPEVRNAAVKKLFSDPRFNVRDAMDVYADDYTKPDPLPDEMLRKLASAQFLRLFEENADDVEEQTVAQSPEDADADLRLQQDDAPAAEDAGDSAGRGTSPAHDAVPPGSGSVPERDQGQ